MSRLISIAAACTKNLHTKAKASITWERWEPDPNFQYHLPNPSMI